MPEEEEQRAAHDERQHEPLLVRVEARARRTPTPGRARTAARAMNAAISAIFTGIRNGVMTPVAIIFEPCGQRRDHRAREQVVELGAEVERRDEHDRRSRAGSAAAGRAARSGGRGRSLRSCRRVGLRRPCAGAAVGPRCRARAAASAGGAAAPRRALRRGGAAAARRRSPRAARLELALDRRLRVADLALGLGRLRLDVALERARGALELGLQLAQLVELHLAADVGLHVRHVALQAAEEVAQRARDLAAGARGRSRSARRRR